MNRIVVVISLVACCLTVGVTRNANADKLEGRLVANISKTAAIVFTDKGEVSVVDGNTRSKTLPSMLELFDGKNGDTPLHFTFDGVSAKGKSIVFSYICADAKLALKEIITSTAEHASCTVELTNGGKSQSLVHLVASVPLQFKDQSISIWDGNSTKEEFTGRNFNDSYQGAFPAVAAYNPNSGIALGMRPDQISSYIENSALYDGDNKQISYGARLVVNPGKTESISFVIYGFTPEYGYLNAIDAYYKISPESFKPHLGTNVDGLYSSDADGIRDFERGSAAGDAGKIYESRRRFFGGVTWWYAIYKKSGQFWGENDEAEWQRPLPKESQLESAYKGSAATYHEALRHQFHRASLRGIIPCYYVLDWCEVDLANRKYKQDILHWKDGTPVRVDGWALGWSDDYCMWWGGRFGDDTYAQFKSAAAALDMDGFALDCGEGNRDRPARPPYNDLSNAAYRAYDEDGIFCDESVGIAEMCDKIHTIKKGDKVMAVYPNWSFAPPYYTAFRVDAVLSEPSFLKAMQEMSTHERIRYLLGEKPRQFLGTNLPRESLGKSVDWKNMTPQQIRDLYRNLYATGLLASFKLAYYPSQDMQSGCPLMCKAMPVLDTLIRSGWQVVPAIKLDPSNLWTARYGHALGSYLFIGNQQVEDQNVKATVDSKYLGEGNYLFCDFNGKGLANKAQSGQTQLQVPIKAKDYAVLKSIMTIKGLDAFTGTVSETSDNRSGLIKADINGVASQAVVSVRIPENCEVEYVKLAGTSIKFSTQGSKATFTAKFGGKTLVELAWKSKVYLSSDKDIQGFSFVDSNYSPACTIVVPDHADDWDISSGTQLSDYFAFYFSEEKGVSVRLPVKKSSELGNSVSRRVEFASPSPNERIPAAGVVEVKGNDLIVKASTSKARNELLLKVMRILDGKYTYYGKIMDRLKDDDTIKMREKAGIGAGGVLQ